MVLFYGPLSSLYWLLKRTMSWSLLSVLCCTNGSAFFTVQNNPFFFFLILLGLSAAAEFFHCLKLSVLVLYPPAPKHTVIWLAAPHKQMSWRVGGRSFCANNQSRVPDHIRNICSYWHHTDKCRGKKTCLKPLTHKIYQRICWPHCLKLWLCLIYRK